MQIIIIILLLFVSPQSDNCEYNGHQLYGRIEFVNDFEDIRIKVVDEFADLDVKKVSSNADRCGEWQVVEDLPDLRVKIVTSGEDLRVRFVDEFEGQ